MKTRDTVYFSIQMVDTEKMNFPSSNNDVLVTDFFSFKLMNSPLSLIEAK